MAIHIFSSFLKILRHSQKKMTYIYKISPAHAGVCFPWQNQNLLVVSDMKRQKLYSELLINGHPWINMMCYHP